jgi:hypothetical protein
MAQSKKFEGEHLAHVVALIEKHGQKGTMAILAAEGNDPLTKLRSKKLFPEPVTVSPPTMVTITREAGIKLTRGKPNPIKTAKQKRYVANLVKKLGSLKAVEVLANGDRNKTLFPKPIKISSPTLCAIARNCGVELSKGRRAA